MNEPMSSALGSDLFESLRAQIQLDPQEVSNCAYAVWEACGRPFGQDQAHWFQAEAQLLFDAAQDRGLLDARNVPAESSTSHTGAKKTGSARRAPRRPRKPQKKKA